jgi:MYXO-CTERM domain-containing protein
MHALPTRPSDRVRTSPTRAAAPAAAALAALLLPAVSASVAQAGAPRCATGEIRELRRAEARVAAGSTAARGGEDCHPGRSPGPEILVSGKHPMRVHYPAELQADAERAIAALDLAWDVQVGEMGWPQPLPDGGLCGSDDLDIFLNTTEGYGFTDSATPDESTPWDDWSAYIVLDVLAYGGDALEATLVHEFNHVVQAALDWWEPIAYFEMSAQYVEYLIWPMAYFPEEVLLDFSGNPEWAVDHDDLYETWFMYGAAEFFLWVDASCVAGAPAWLSDAWRAARSEAGPDVDVPNEPDIRDGLDEVLGAACELDFWDAALKFREVAWFGAGDPAVIAGSEGWDPDATRPRSTELDASGSGEVLVDLKAEDTGAAYFHVIIGENDPDGLILQAPDGWLTQQYSGGGDGSLDLMLAPEPDRARDADDPAPDPREGTMKLSWSVPGDGDDDSGADDDDDGVPLGDDDGDGGAGCACGASLAAGSRAHGLVALAGAVLLLAVRRRRIYSSAGR